MLRRFISIGLTLSLIGLVQPASGTQSSAPFICADEVHAQGITGRGVTVVVIDGGVYRSHAGLASSLGGGISSEGGHWVFDGGANQDGHPHGTIMSLIITDATGVAPDARIYPIRAAGPGCTESDVIRAIGYAVDRNLADPTFRVINLSILIGDYGYPCPCDDENAWTTRLAAEISRAAAANIITFACTGNHADCGYLPPAVTGIQAPACISSAVPVVAIYDAYYPPIPSSVFHGVCPEAAPQPSLVTCFSNIAEGCGYLLAGPGYDISVGGFAPESGTSDATAHASGVAALMFEKNACGALDAYEARTILYESAEVCIPRVGCELDFALQVNALAAVNAVAGPSPAVVLGDLDCDSTVAAMDFHRLQDCMTGPGGGPVNGFCVSADFPSSPADGDVDMHDFARFQLAFTGYGSGACCHWDGTCSITPVNVCAEEFGATYQGHDTTCVGVECPQPDWGACCTVATQTCRETTREDCIWGQPGLGDEGMYLGDGTHCDTAVCPDPQYHNIADPLTTYVECGPGLQLADDIYLQDAEPSLLAYYSVGVYGGNVANFNVTIGLYEDDPASGLLIPGTERTFMNIPNTGSPVFLTATFDPPERSGECVA